jgi:Cellulase (glycosyl hydrolase family 5)
MLVRAPLYAVLLVGSLLLTNVQAEEKLAPPATAVPSSLFDLNVINLEWGASWPTVKFYGWRDGHSVWVKLEPQKGKWNFTQLDKEVRMGEEHGVEMMLVLGTTPTWASARPDEAGCCGPSSPKGTKAEAASASDWRNYITQVASRYKGRVHIYELWNEPDVARFFSGTPEKLAQINQQAYDALKAVDPSITVVSSSMSGSGTAIPFLQKYFAAGGGKSADVIGYHFYVGKRLPEAMLEPIQQVRSLMRQNGINKPLWNTETGWRFSNDDRNKQDPADDWLGRFLNPDESSAYVARAYLLSWAAGVERLYWYAWGHQTMGLTEFDERTPKAAAQAYSQVQDWLLGARVVSCSADSDDTWTCQITRDGGYSGWIVWNPSHDVHMDLPASWKVRQARLLSGETKNLSSSKQLSITFSPQLFENAAR